MRLGRSAFLCCFFSAAALVLLCGLHEVSKELGGSGIAAGRVELLTKALKARGATAGHWQDLAVWNGNPEDVKEHDVDSVKSNAGIEPKWLAAAAGRHETKGDTTPFSAGGDDDQLEETRELRKRLGTAERELEEAQKKLERAEGGVNGKSDTIAGQQVGSWGDVKMEKVKGPEIKFSKTLLSNGEVVRIEWSGVTEVTPLDFIALYTPPGAANHDYLEMHNVTESSTWRLGRGSIPIKLYNHRKEGGYELRYFRKGLIPNNRGLFTNTDSNLGSMIFCLSRHCKNEDTYFLVSISPVPAHFAVHEPTQVRLALTGVPTQMRVMWVNEKCPGKPLGGAAVLLGEESCSKQLARTCRYKQMFTPLYRTYGAEDLCGPPANLERAQNFMDPGYIYDALLTGLQPGRRYYYRLGCQDAPDGWHEAHLSHDSPDWGYPAGSMMSEEMSFVAAPWTSRKATVTFAAYSDSGITTHQRGAHTTWGAPERVNAAIAKEVDGGSIGMVLHMGDLSYADGRSYMWEQWGALTQSIASKVPYMVTVGNHEYTHKRSLIVAITAPAGAEGVYYNALPASFGPQLTAWHGDSALKGAVVRAGGNFYKGADILSNLTDDFCLEELPDAEALVQGRLLYKDKLVLVEAAGCGYARQVKVAELYGASGAILFAETDDPPAWSASAWNLPLSGQMPHEPPVDESTPVWTDRVDIASVFLSRRDGLDLLQWVDDHSAWEQSVMVSIRSSEGLQANDPSIGSAGGTAVVASSAARATVLAGGKEDDEKLKLPSAAVLTGDSEAHTETDGFHPEWGNYEDDSRGECGVPFAQRFHMPSNYGGNGNFWYSFEYGPVRIVSISSEHSLEVGSPQRGWLRKTLAAIDRKVSPWVIVTMHRSIYGRTESLAEQEVSNHLQAALEPIFKKNKVNLILSGHEHRYLRTAPVYMDLNMASARGGWGSTYAMVATGGAKLQYRARDEVHNHYYCVGGAYPMKRCKACTGANKFVCHDRQSCCEPTVTGGYWKCGYCEHINATGPGDWKATSRAGPRDAQQWGWQRKMLSDFGYMRIKASEFKMQLDFVQTINVYHTPTVDKDGRSLHLPEDMEVGCRDSCTNDMLPDGRVMDRLVLTRKKDGALHAEDSEVTGFADREYEEPVGQEGHAEWEQEAQQS